VIENIRNICRENQQLLWLATDRPERTGSPLTSNINYRFNSRGFRDHEWPDNLDNTSWLLGGSHMVGVGLSFEDTATVQLNSINVSILNASNSWIARQILWLFAENIKINNVIIQWQSVLSTELDLKQAKSLEFLALYKDIKKFHWPKVKTVQDLNLVNPIIMENLDQDPYGRKVNRMRGAQETAQIPYRPERLFCMGGARSLIEDIVSVEAACLCDTKLIHAFAPGFATDKEKQYIYSTLDEMQISYVPELKQIDYSRDNKHSGIQTVRHFVAQVKDQLVC